MNIAETYVVSVIFSGSPREYDYLGNYIFDSPIIPG